MAGRNENVDEVHSFILRLIVATGDPDCEVDACVLCLHFVCDGSGGKLVVKRGVMEMCCGPLRALSSV